MRSVTDQTTGRLTTAILGAAVFLAAVGCPVDALAAPLKPVRAPSAIAVDLAIDGGLEFIFANQQDDGHIPSRHANTHPGAAEALAALAALTAGRAPSEPRLAAAIDYARRSRPETVCARALRLILLSRLGEAGDKPHIEADAAWLTRANQLGGWGDGPGHPSVLYRPRRTDTLNSHLAVWALAEATEAGATVPASVWKQSRDFWTKAQNADGGWGFEPHSNSESLILGESMAPTTAAAMASIITLECKRLQTGEGPYNTIGQRTGFDPPDLKAFVGAWKWLAGHYNPETIPGLPLGKADGWYMPYLLGFTRAAEGAGARLIEGDRWLMRLADHLVASRQGDGRWGPPDGGTRDGMPVEAQTGDDVIRTGLATWALARARAGVLINKLTVGTAWQTDFFDAYNLSRWYQRNCGQAVSWRLIDPKARFGEFAQAPLLYINGRNEFAMPEAFAAKALHYLRNGGTILVNCQGSDRQFARGAAAYFTKLLPDYHETRIEPTHPIYTLRFTIPVDKQPPTTGVGDHCRTRIFIVNKDISGAWNCNLHAARPEAFQLAANIALYGMNGQHPQSKFAAPPVPPPKPAKRQIRMARIVHGGDWNTNPLASARLSDVLADAMSIGVAEEAAVPLTAPAPAEVPVLWLTGTKPALLALTPRNNLKAYILGGGTLLIDPAMGGKAFFDDAKAMLEKLFGKEGLKQADAHSEILTGLFAGGIGSDVTLARYTTWPGRKAPKRSLPEVWTVEISGRIAVVLSRNALACPAEGLPTYGCLGLARDDARRLMTNVLLYAASRR